MRHTIMHRGSAIVEDRLALPITNREIRNTSTSPCGDHDAVVGVCVMRPNRGFERL